MTTDRDLAAAWLIDALRDIPDPPADLHAARLQLRRRTRRATVQRRWALVAITAAAAVLGLAVFQGVPHPRSTPPPAKQLQSGLPLGTLEGQVHYLYPDGHTDEFGGRITLKLVVRADATGTYSLEPPGRPLNGTTIWPVRYVGAAPGRVTLTHHNILCTQDDTVLTLDFTVHGDTVTIQHAATGECSAFPDESNVDLRGVVLRVISRGSPTR